MEIKLKNKKAFKVKEFTIADEAKLKDIPSDWIEVQKNGEPLEEKKKSKSKK